MTLTIERIQESANGGTLTVDETAGVIRGVKVLGLTSKNKRRYTPEAARKAIPMYEGKGIFANHKRRKDASEDRDFDHKFAWLESVRQDADGGLSADLHYLKTDPRGPKLAEAARRRPDLFGLSHDAEGSVKTVNGETIVEEIRNVYSVDVVTDPATTKSLRESKLISLSEITIHDDNQILAALVESGYGEEGVYDEGDGDPIKAAFRSVIDAILDGDGTLDEQIKKIKLILTTQEKLMADAAKPADKPAPEAGVTMESFNELKAAHEADKAEIAKLTEAVNKLLAAKDEAIVDLPESKRGAGQDAKPGTYEAEAAKLKNRFGVAKA